MFCSERLEEAREEKSTVTSRQLSKLHACKRVVFRVHTSSGSDPWVLAWAVSGFPSHRSLHRSSRLFRNDGRSSIPPSPPPSRWTVFVTAQYLLSRSTGGSCCALFLSGVCVNVPRLSGYPENSRRYYWAVRALEVGSLLSFLYSLLLVMLLSDLKLVYTQNDRAHFGVGF